MSRALGWRPDPPDARDHDALKVLRAPIAPAVVARSTFVDVLDQGLLGSCTVNAVAQAIRCNELQQLVASGMTLEAAKAATEFLARLFPYYFARAISHETQMDAGTFIRFVFQVLNTYGFPRESIWPYSDDGDPRTGRFAKMPSTAAVRAAYDQCLAAAGGDVVRYSRIGETNPYARADAMKRAHDDGHLVVFGTDVSVKLTRGDINNGKPIPPPLGEAIAGGHAMVTGGHDADGADVLNSWGAGFGDGGWCRFSWDYLTWAKTTDLWIVQRAPIFSEQVSP